MSTLHTQKAFEKIKLPCEMWKHNAGIPKVRKKCWKIEASKFGLYLPPSWIRSLVSGKVVAITRLTIPGPLAVRLVPSKSCAFDLRTQTWCLHRSEYSVMSTKVWSSSLRTVFVFSKSLCSGVFKKFSMWVLATMDCLRSLYNIIGIRFFMMALIKIWTLILYVLRRNLKKVWRELHK